ncbi:MAG: DUF1801 domain-containing protein [Chloroflexia bacterium]
MARTSSKKSIDELVVEHSNPLKAEVQAVREIIKAAHPDINEEWKWNAPSFSYKGQYLLTFNLWENRHIYLVWHNPQIVNISSPLLEGDYPTRRMTYLADMNDIEAKRSELQEILQELIRLTDKQ